MYDKIKRLAEERGVTIAELERHLKISNGTISKWNKSKPRLDFALRVAKYFEISVEDLFKN
ncbi:MULTISPECIES: helix-turn-helix transcriptional regulator [unclassified Enterococcus]|uniref:helix-turn-helix transcriptional regulator n=1 Tax=unclassified Enterococcus TaxID=2608891 RepID=UPI001555FB65|nr:helix-turn-helix transcriptional regulator [Enterococcus sp. MMGLQ5-2]MBS7584180.1 helix-turn-helix transcriptional regulator [Enterococcus sp. MMGLQ5-1]NPD12038.1 helix-turn-helix transcriptional regulator [Enterococcus sp. MMGLQ5-1]NPD37459.1 helix-turn-helix transcriptional regulator [Enterococcus sp. MMGLQ5-2]